MNSFKNLLLVAALLCVGLSLGCTRKANESTLSLKMNFAGTSQSKAGALAVAGELDFAVINVHTSTGLVVKTFEFRDQPAAASGFTAEIPGIPKGNILVQFFGVYRDSSSAMQRFGYGDASASVAGGGAVSVSITANEIGSATKEGRLTGRYIDRVTPTETGPTGELIMQYQPPGAVPAVSIERRPIVDGWFSIFMLNGAPLNYRLAETGEMIFNQVQLSGASAVINGNTLTTGAHLLQFSKPLAVRKEGDSPEFQPPAEVFVGFLQKAGLNVLGTKQVCFANDVSEAIPGLFTNTSYTTPMDFVSSGAGTAADMRWIAGGTGGTQAEVYSNTAAGCTATGANKILLYHTMIGSDSDRAGGIATPFLATAPFQRWDNFIQSKYHLNVSTPTITLNWALLPGVTSPAGVTVFAKYVGNGGTDGGGGNQSCKNLEGDGYSEVANVTPLSTMSYAFTGIPGGQAVSASNYWGWVFALCGYQGDRAAGTHKWLGSYVDGGRVSGDGDQFHMGWAPASATTVGTTTVNHAGEILKVTNIDSSSSSLYTDITLFSSISTLTAGDEVLFHVSGANGVGACGSYYGSSIGVGTYGFSRVISASSSNLKVVKGGLIDQITTTNLTGTPDSATTFCFVQVAKVMQFRNLDLSGTNSYVLPSGFDYTTSGGIMPIRVNGTVTLGSTSISVNEKGYVGGSTTLQNAAGASGAANNTLFSGTGGAGGTDGGGGGGYGSGASSTTPVNGGSGQSSWSNWWRFVLGGGGGAGGSGPVMGGKGGGAIFFMAREVQVTGVSEISASGGNGATTSFGGGGGGGGSIVFITRQLAGAGSLVFKANGGSGGVGNAGVGGGGSVQALICASTLGASPTAQVGVGASGNTTGAQVGHSEFFTPSNQYQCSEYE